jgi:hypothetical protein
MTPEELQEIRDRQPVTIGELVAILKNFPQDASVSWEDAEEDYEAGELTLAFDESENVMRFRAYV